MHPLSVAGNLVHLENHIVVKRAFNLYPGDVETCEHHNIV